MKFDRVFKRILSGFLAAVFMAGYVPVPIMAEETEYIETESESVETEPESETETEPESEETEPESDSESESESETETEPESETETESESETETETETEPESETETEPESETETESDTESDTESETESESETETAPETEPETEETEPIEPETEETDPIEEEITAYKVYVGGVQLTEANAADVFSDMSVSYDEAVNTLYLTDAYIDTAYITEDGYEYGIFAAEDLNIEVSGRNTVVYEIFAAGELNIAGEGMLTEGSETTVFSDFTLTEDLYIEGTWNFINGAVLVPDGYSVTFADDAVILTDGVVHEHNTDGNITYSENEDDPENHIKITQCAECLIGYTTTESEPHELPEDSNECACGLIMISVMAVTDNDIELNTPKDITIAAGETVKLAYTPAYTHSYILKSSTGSAFPYTTHGYVYDADGNQLSYRYFNTSTVFSVGYILEAGVTYYFGIKYYSTSTTGTVSLTLEEGDHSYTKNENGEYVCGCGDIAEDVFKLDETRDIPLANKEHFRIPFIPEITHSYTFVTEGSQYINYLYYDIYDANGTKLTSYNGSNYDSIVRYITLNAGSTYYLDMYYTDGSNGTLTTSAVLGTHDYELDENGEYSCICGDVVETIEVGELRDMTVTTGIVSKVMFVPEITHSYILKGKNASYFYGRIYDADEKQLAYNYDDYFSVAYTLEEGKIYYIGTSYHLDNVSSGEFPIMLDYGFHNYTENENGERVCVCGATEETITFEEQKTVSVSAGQIVTMPFVSEYSHDYVFKSIESGNSAHGYVFDASGNLLQYGAAYGDPFAVNQTLEAGVTYYFGVATFDESAEVPVIVEATNHKYTVQTEDGYACVCGKKPLVLKRGEELDVEFAVKEKVQIPFIPDVTHRYGLSVKASLADEQHSIQTAIYDSAGNRISTSITSYNDYSINVSLTAGETYYIEMSVSSATVETVPIKIEYTEHTYVKNEDGMSSICSQCGKTISSILLGQRMDVDISAGETVKIPFTPEITHDYAFTGASQSGVYVYIYDSAGKVIAPSSSYTSFATCTLTAGETYYLGVKYSDAGTAGTVPVWIDYTNHNFVENEDGDHVCECSVGWRIADETLTFFGKGGIGHYSSSSSALAPWSSYKDSFSSVVMEEGITTIGQYSFYNLSNIESVTLPESATYIGNDAFYKCTLLDEISVPDKVTYIGNYAFYNCSTLADVKLPAGLTYLGAGAFYECTSMNNIELPDGLTYIGASAFNRCSSLTEMIIPDSVTYLGTSAFSSCSKLQKVQLSKNMNTIYRETFYACSALNEVIIPEGITSIQYRAFLSCSELRSAELPSTLKTIGESAFSSCSSLTELVIPEGVTTVEKSAFSYCSSLRSLTLPGTLAAIETSVFSGCAGLTELVIPSGVKTIKSQAFYNCQNLTKITFSDTVTQIDANAFQNCKILEEIVWNTKNCENISADVFRGNTGLKTVVIGPDVDLLSLEFLNAIRNTITEENLAKGYYERKELVFQGPNYFTVEDVPYEEIFTSPLDDFTAGYYYADEYGVLYRIENNEATLIYCPPGLTEYTVPAQTMALGNEGPYPVTGVGNNVLIRADDLTSLTFENPEGITYIASMAMADCPTLSSVNGETTTDDAEALFTNPDAYIGKNIFQNTGLTDASESVGTLVTYPIVVTEENAPQLTITSNAAGREFFYTGEPCDTSIAVSNNYNQERHVIRVYFQFSDTDATTSYSLGTFYVTGSVDKGSQQYEMNVCATDSDTIYYYELEQPKEGDTIVLNVDSLYPSPNSDGGTVKIWGVVLPKEEADGMKNEIVYPDEKYEYHQFEWRTKPDDYLLSKTNTSNRIAKLAGDGGTEHKIYIENLSYTVSFTRDTAVEDDREGLNIGRDYMRVIEYVDVLTLPEGLANWRDGLIDAIKNGSYKIYKTSSGSSYTLTYYVIIGGVSYLLCTVSLTNTSSISYTPWLGLTEDGTNVVLRWRAKNISPEYEMILPSAVITYGTRVICVTDPEKVTEDTELTFINKVDTVQHFTYSDPITQTASAENTAGTAAPDFKVNKNDYFMTQQSRLGSEYNFQIYLENSTPLPYKGITKVSDTLPTMLYIKPEDMHLMFDENAAENDSMLVLTIVNATLCEKAPEGTVIGTDGKEYPLVNPTTGVNTEYHGLETEDSTGNTYATIVIEWAEKGKTLKLTVKDQPAEAEDGTTPEATVLHEFIIGEGGDFESIGDALTSINYLVTGKTYFSVQWMLSEDYTLWGGEKRYYYVRSSIKDTFMYTDVDVQNLIASESLPRYVYNYVYAYYMTADSDPENPPRKGDSEYFTPYRDFELYKTASVNGTMADEYTVLKEGDIAEYTVEIKDYGYGDYDALPLTDHLQGGQVLLVPAAGNEHLTSEYNLGIETIDGEQYYVLDKPGTYEKITLGGYLADSVTVRKTDTEGEDVDGLSTLIRWYLVDPKDEYSEKIVYKALISPTRSECEGTAYILKNEAWLGDHQSHRLWDIVYLFGTRVTFDKSIVTAIGEQTPGDDILTDYSSIHEGEVITYRFRFEGFTNEEVDLFIPGSELYDVLPASIDSYWSKENITIRYVDSAGDELTLLYGGDWYVTSNSGDGSVPDSSDGTSSSDRQYIRWPDAFSLPIDGIVYIYVTLTFPSDDDSSDDPSADEWTAYAQKYVNTRLQNDLYVYDMKDTVYHDLAIKAEALLQKGVYKTGLGVKSSGSYSYFEWNDSESSRQYYVNDDLYDRVVSYYITLYNAGDGRLYINDLQDVLPKSFTYYTILTSTYYNDTYVIKRESGTTDTSSRFTLVDTDKTVSDHRYPKWVNATVSVSVTEEGEGLEAGQQKLTFTLSSNKTQGYLKYDELLEKYYLDPGEGLKFAYVCHTNDSEDTLDIATNRVAMPYYDHLNAGVNVTDDVRFKGQTVGKALQNDGDCTVLDNEKAETYGFTGGTSNTEWLESEVKLVRGGIWPGITKQLNQTNEHAHPQDTVEWKITMTNSGEHPLVNYNITDVMQVPYGFVNTLTYNIYYNTEEMEARILSTLFTIKRRENNIIYIVDGSGTEHELVTDGTMTEISVPVDYYWTATSSQKATVSVNVSIAPDTKGNEVLTLHFPDESMNIPEGGRAELILSTKNLTNVYSNTVFYNSAYLTPNVQPYNQDQVSQGQNTTLNGKPSVHSSALITVAYGYFTSSVKTVEEVDNRENKAYSNSDNNYIVLPSEQSKFDYTLLVENTTDKAMDELVIIDNLPEPDDHSVFTEEEKRFSEFTVALADEPNFIVTVTDALGMETTTLTEEQYSVSYSTKTLFTNDDWTGKSEWAAEHDAGTRSFRIVIEDDTGALIPTGATVAVKFTAQITGDDAEPNEKAWNSFGYHYSLLNDATVLEAAPEKVGIMIPSVPDIRKALKLENGTEYKAEKDETFRFIIYEGAEIELPDEYSDEKFAAILENEEAPRRYTYAELTVKAGESVSETLVLKNAVEYTYAEGEWTPKTVETTDSDGNVVYVNAGWVWEDGAQYTVVELPLSGDDFTQGAINGGTAAGTLTFTHSYGRKLVLEAVNYRSTWDAVITKTDSLTVQALPGAVFALYSPVEADMIGNEAYAVLEAELELSPDKQLTVADEETGGEAVYYLTQVLISDANGYVRWTGLLRREYYVSELKAPDGYAPTAEPIRIESADYSDVSGITVPNSMMYTLPETGGAGTQLYTISGVLLAAVGLLGCAVDKRRRRRMSR